MVQYTTCPEEKIALRKKFSHFLARGKLIEEGVQRRIVQARCDHLAAFALVRELLAPAALIVLGAVLLFNPDSASALISKLLGWCVIAFAIGFGIAAIASDTGKMGKGITAVILAVVGGWLTNNPLALAAWIGRLVGIFLVVDGVQDILHLRSQGQRFVLPLIATVVGAVLILLPMTTTRLVFSVCGAVVLFIGIIMLLDRLRGKKQLRSGDSDIIDVDAL